VWGKVAGLVLNKVNLERNSCYYSQYYGNTTEATTPRAPRSSGGETQSDTQAGVVPATGAAGTAYEVTKTLRVEATALEGYDWGCVPCAAPRTCSWRSSSCCLWGGSLGPATRTIRWCGSRAGRSRA
jgi:hypothetical protein